MFSRKKIVILLAVLGGVFALVLINPGHKISFLAHKAENNNAKFYDSLPAGQNEEKSSLVALSVGSIANSLPSVQKSTAQSTEIVEKRTETSKTFDNHDGTYTLQTVMAQEHYKDNYSNAAEPWKEIDPSLYTDFAEYRLYDHLPFIVKVFKNKTGYEISSKKANQKYLVLLDSIDGVKTEKYENSADFNFEYEIKSNAVRLWKNLLTPNAPKNFVWKISETGSGELTFRENPEAFDLESREPIKIETKRTPIAQNSFYWEEIAPRSGIKIDTDVNVPIAASSDDATEVMTWWDNGSINFYSNPSTMPIGESYDSGYDDQLFYNAGYRFLDVAVPNSASISAAAITLIIDSSFGNPSLVIKGIAEDNTATWSGSSRMSQRTKTSNSVAWNPAGTSGSVTTPSIVSIIGEITSRPGWASGNALGISIENIGNDYGTGIFKYFRTFDYGSSYPLLSITYAGGGGGSSSASYSPVILKPNVIFNKNIIFK